MVTEGRLSRPSSTTNSDGEQYQVETVSTASSSSEDLECDSAVVLHDDRLNEEAPSFNNISVANSTDIHFGNKTFYQGPVTIKQFLYANGKVQNDNGDRDSVGALKGGVVLDATGVANGLDNPVFVTDIQHNKQIITPNKPVAQETSSGVLKGFRRLQQFSQQHFAILVSLLALLVVSLAILMIVLLARHGASPVDDNNLYVPKGDTDEQDKVSPIDAPLDPAVNLTLSGKLKLVSRIEWVAQPPVQPATPLHLPVPYVIIHHTATENCSSQAQCIFQMRYIQMFHIESKNWWDIGYNFAVGGDGEAYEGRGWKSEGAHSYGYNSKSIGIAFIGTFIKMTPPKRQIVACKQLIAKGVELGYIRRDYKLLAARQLQTTQSPGAMLYEDMKTWDHWAKQP